MRSIPSSFHPLPTFHAFTRPLSDDTASRRADHQGQDRNKDRDILSNVTRFCCRDNPPPPLPPHRLHLPGKQTRTQSQTVDPHTRYQREGSGRVAPPHTNVHIRSRPRTRSSFKMQRGDVLQREKQACKHFHPHKVTHSRDGGRKKHRKSRRRRRRRCPTISPTGPPSNPLLLPLLSPSWK